MSLNMALSISKTDTLLSLIIKGKERMLLPICNDLAYLDCNITNKETCQVNIGQEYYIQTNLDNARKIIQRRNDYENSKAPSQNKNLTKLDDNTFEIIEKEDELHMTTSSSISNNDSHQRINIEDQRSIILNHHKSSMKSGAQVNQSNEVNEIKVKSGRDFLLSLIQKNKNKSIPTNKYSNNQSI